MHIESYNLIFITATIFFFLSFMTNVTLSSMVNSGISLIFMFVWIFCEKRLKRLIAKIVPILGILSYLFLTHSIATVFTISGLIFGVLASMETDILKMKLFYLGSNLSWLMFSIFANVYGAILFDTVGFFGLMYFFFNYFGEVVRGIKSTPSKGGRLFNIQLNRSSPVLLLSIFVSA